MPNCQTLAWQTVAVNQTPPTYISTSDFAQPTATATGIQHAVTIPDSWFTLISNYIYISLH